MNAAFRLLAMAARHGRYLLVLGLVAGLGLPDVALAMRPWLQELVAALLFLAALRIGPRKAFGAIADLPVTLGLVAVFQLLSPLAALAVFAMAGLPIAGLAMAIVLMLSGTSISGSPNLTIMTGSDPAPALRLLILGTALLPATVFPVLWFLPQLGDIQQVLAACGKLLGVIGAATLGAFAVRMIFAPDPDVRTLNAMDGLSAIAMAVIVVGLMSAAGPALVHAPSQFFFWLAAACLANFGMQIASALVLSRTAIARDLVPYSIIAGNRNIALFLVALPAEVTDPLLLFIGCYQIPMYLTPLLLGWFYRRARNW